MNDSMMMQAAARHDELTREAGTSRRVAKAHATTSSRSPRRGSLLATVTARLRPTTARRWQAQ
ncbi:MAG TPA: hypothetical protein VHZ33_30075 [Trebonia sp.]|jgi:hypothetical protein|nr:hypothetical protein [Trebonia sp.]